MCWLIFIFNGTGNRSLCMFKSVIQKKNINQRWKTHCDTGNISSEARVLDEIKFIFSQ